MAEGRKWERMLEWKGKMCENVIVWLEKKRYIIVTVNMSKEKEIVRHI